MLPPAPWRLRSGNTGQTCLSETTELAHAHSMTEAHVTRNRQPRPGLAEARRIEPVLRQQRVRIVVITADRFGKALDKPYRQITEAQVGMLKARD